MNKIPIYHNIGYDACLELGCYFIGEKFEKGIILLAEDFELLDGTNPKPDDYLRCGNCGGCMYIRMDCLYKVYNKI